MTLTVSGLNRYPFKGMRAEPLDTVTLAPGALFPGDRQFALAHGASGFDPAAPAWRPKSDFVMLARNEILAGFEGRVGDGGMLRISRNGREIASGDPDDAADREAIEAKLTEALGADARGSIRLAGIDTLALTDTPEPWVSLVSAGTVAAVEAAAGAPVDPVRFRANIVIEGAAAWKEFVWVDQDVRIGEVVLRAKDRIDRCAATTVNPDTGARDLNVLKLLQANFGHVDFGIFLEVIEGGAIRVGDPVVPPQS